MHILLTKVYVDLKLAEINRLVSRLVTFKIVTSVGKLEIDGEKYTCNRLHYT